VQIKLTIIDFIVFAELQEAFYKLSRAIKQGLDLHTDAICCAMPNNVRSDALLFLRMSLDTYSL
jgi:hypothetical protein